MTKNDPPLNEPGIVFDDDMVLEDTQQAKKKSADDNAYLFESKVQKKQAEKKPPVNNSNPDNHNNEELEFVVESEVEIMPETPASDSKEVQVMGGRDVKKDGDRQRIGDQLVSMGLITPDQLNVALQEKKISGRMVGEILVELGFIDAETLSDFLSESSGFSVFDPKSTIIDSEALNLIDKKIAQKHHILPVSIADDQLMVAMADPYDVVALDTLKARLRKGLKVKPMVTTPQVLADAIDAAYGYASSVNAILKELEGRDPDELDDITSLTEEEAYSHPLVRLVNALIFEAVKIGASDLHFEPEENFVRLRYRLDGVLSTVQILHRQHWNGVAQRIKLMASLNIADKLTAQDGRIQMSVAGRDVDFRVSSLPTVHGENIVMRVLDKQSSIMTLAELGFSELNLENIKKSQKRPEGIIIVTGPTGSGKTTSLYSMLNEINSVDVNIQTLEDPVEYSLPMIRQTQVREGILEFADGIRAMLRQDPDIIFIGEIRDKTTAEMALQAAMTGHQVYTTLHTNDSFGALPRLFDLGMVPGMVAGNIISVFAQRLTRKLCPNCKEGYTANEEECQLLGVDSSPEIFKARQGGCDQCAGQGYKGRTALAEILMFDEEMDEVVAHKGTKAELKQLAVAKGFKNMKDDGMLKILEGITSFEAVSKVVDITK
jgi:type II secretory ATPase GspE/PulE/Tfp pilus assembly ATPase PilB-like protein